MFSPPLLMAIAVDLADPFNAADLGRCTQHCGALRSAASAGDTLRMYQRTGCNNDGKDYTIAGPILLNQWFAVDGSWELYWSPICYDESI